MEALRIATPMNCDARFLPIGAKVSKEMGAVYVMDEVGVATPEGGIAPKPEKPASTIAMMHKFKSSRINLFSPDGRMVNRIPALGQTYEYARSGPSRQDLDFTTVDLKAVRKKHRDFRWLPVGARVSLTSGSVRDYTVIHVDRTTRAWNGDYPIIVAPQGQEAEFVDHLINFYYWRATGNAVDKERIQDSQSEINSMGMTADGWWTNSRRRDRWGIEDFLLPDVTTEVPGNPEWYQKAVRLMNVVTPTNPKDDLNLEAAPKRIELTVRVPTAPSLERVLSWEHW